MDTKKIFIGIPTNRGLQPQMVLSLLNMVKYTKHELVFVMATQGYTISENRNYLVIQALKNKCSHILMIDDDMTFPDNTLDQLLSNEKEIVGVVAHSRALPLMPVVEFFDQHLVSEADRLLGRWNIPEELFECKAVGGGVLLIDLKVFDTLPKPYFSTEVLDTGFTKTGEDSWFCYRAGENGFKIWCDPTLKIGHIGNYIF